MKTPNWKKHFDSDLRRDIANLREFHEHRLTVRRSKHYAVAWCPKCFQFWIHADKWSAVQETFPEMVHLLGGRVT